MLRRSLGISRLPVHVAKRFSYSPSRQVAAKAGFGRRLWETYSRCLQQQPLLTKATMASFIFFTSDSITQCIMSKDDIFHWQPSRALSGASFGIVATMWMHYWWGFLEVAAGARVPVAQYRLGNTLLKVVIDQSIGAPLYIYSYYILTNALSSALHQSREEFQATWTCSSQKASEMLWPTMYQHWKIWPMVHCVNFYYIPLHHRVLVQNCVLVGWSGYLSYLNNNNNTTHLMTPDEEINVAIVRRESEANLRNMQRRTSFEERTERERDGL